MNRPQPEEGAMEDRVVKLETMLSFQVEAMDRLTHVVDEQQIQIRQLEQHVRGIEEQLCIMTPPLPTPERQIEQLQYD